MLLYLNSLLLTALAIPILVGCACCCDDPFIKETYKKIGTQLVAVQAI